MSYTKTNWQDEVDATPSLYNVDGVPKNIVKNTSGITVFGTDANASNFNKIEDELVYVSNYMLRRLYGLGW